MNYSDYPSIELCHKFTEIGFPKTEFSVNSIPGMLFKTNDTTKKEGMYYCPSVMEILDNINLGSCYELIIKKQYDYDEGYCFDVEFKYIEKCIKKYEERKEKDRIHYYKWYLNNREKHNLNQKKAYNKKHNNL